MQREHDVLCDIDVEEIKVEPSLNDASRDRNGIYDVLREISNISPGRCLGVLTVIGGKVTTGRTDISSLGYTKLCTHPTPRDSAW